MGAERTKSAGRVRGSGRSGQFVTAHPAPLGFPPGRHLLPRGEKGRSTAHAPDVSHTAFAHPKRRNARGDQPMPYETILYEVDDAILTITLHRPDKLNAFTTRMLDELIDAFDRGDKDDAVTAVIVTGAGRAFCAGAGLSAGGATFDRAARPDRPQVPLGADGPPDLASDAERDGGGRGPPPIFSCHPPGFAAQPQPSAGRVSSTTTPTH